MKYPFEGRVKHCCKIISIAVGISIIAAGCSSSPAAGVVEPKAGVQEQALKTVKVAKIGKQKISEPTEQVADVVSAVQLDIVTKAAGDVVEVVKKRGDIVRKGDVIFRLDPADAQTARDKAALAVEKAQEDLRKTKSDFEINKAEMQNNITKSEASLSELEKSYSKLRNDFDSGLAAKNQLDSLQTQLTNAKNDLELLKKKQKALESSNPLLAGEQQLKTSRFSLQDAETAVQHMEVKAPANGFITDLGLQEGMTLSSGFRAGQLQQLDPIKIKAELTEASAALIKEKKELTFLLPGSGEKMKGAISYLANVMSAQTKAYSLELEVSNADGKLKPGSKVQILLTDDEEQLVTVVPTLSIVREGGSSFVFVLAGDTVEKRKVELGRLNETNQEILSGVKPDEQLVILGQHQLKDKEKVQLVK